MENRFRVVVWYLVLTTPIKGTENTILIGFSVKTKQGIFVLYISEQCLHDFGFEFYHSDQKERKHSRYLVGMVILTIIA